MARSLCKEGETLATYCLIHLFPIRLSVQFRSHPKSGLRRKNHIRIHDLSDECLNGKMETWNYDLETIDSCDCDADENDGNQKEPMKEDQVNWVDILG